MSATARSVLKAKRPGPASREPPLRREVSIRDPYCHCSPARNPQLGGAAGRPQAPASVMRAPSHCLCRSFAGTNFRGDTPTSLSAPGWEAVDVRPVRYLFGKLKPTSCSSDS